MNLRLLCATMTIGAFGMVGCAGKSTDTYKGDAVESGKMIIKTMGGAEAKNETPAHKVENQSVVVTRDGSSYTAKFGNCELKGESSTATLAIVKGACDISVAKTDYNKFPLSATLSFGDGSLKMEVIGNQKNDSAVVSYEWTFEGKK